MKIKTRNYVSRGKTYPEQSQRQALRRHRRAQGGPGITTGKDPVARAT